MKKAITIILATITIGMSVSLGIIVNSTAVNAKTVSTSQASYKILENDSKKWAKKLTKAERKALINYSKNNYKDDNGYLRSGKAKNKNTPNEVKNIISALKKGKLTKSMTVFRGVDYESFKLGLHGQKMHVGAKYLDPAFQSTSIYKNVALGFTNIDKIRSNENILLKINLPKKSNGAYLFPLSKNNFEYEFLMNANQKMVIKKIQNAKSKIEIQVSGKKKSEKVNLSYKLITMELIK